jgi:starvation-inducible outer membrane lipoprotein
MDTSTNRNTIMAKILIVFIAALMTGCASVPQTVALCAACVSSPDTFKGINQD